MYPYVFLGASAGRVLHNYLMTFEERSGTLSHAENDPSIELLWEDFRITCQSISHFSA
jgi:hypothetical protein